MSRTLAYAYLPYLLVRRPERRSEAETVAVEQSWVCHLEVASMIAFTERFAVIVRERRGVELSAWLADAEASAI
ncbi:MAG: hypothetical protein ACR2M3_12205 [Thermomicrobiales bacterium]